MTKCGADLMFERMTSNYIEKENEDKDLVIQYVKKIDDLVSRSKSRCLCDPDKPQQASNVRNQKGLQHFLITDRT